MELSAREAKLVERLRKEERLWPRARWWMLGTGLLVLVIYSYAIFAVWNAFPYESTGKDISWFTLWTFIFAFAWPKCLLGFVFGAWCIVKAIVDWHGNVNRMLLLKLLDAQLKQAERDVKRG